MTRIRQLFKKLISPFTNNKQSDFLSQSILLEEGGNMRLVIVSISTICLVISALIIWASVVSIKEVTIAVGEIQPVGQIQKVQHLEGGIVNHLYSSEGATVPANQTVLTLSETMVVTELEKMMQQEIALMLDRLRLRTFIEEQYSQYHTKALQLINQLPQPKHYLQMFAKLIEDQEKLLLYQADARHKQRKVIQAQLAQQSNTQEDVTARIHLTQKQLALLRKEKNIYDGLKGSDAVSDMTYIELDRNVNNQQGELKKLRIKQSQTNNSIKETQERLLELSAQYKETALQEIRKKDTELLETRAKINKLMDQAKRLQVKAPVTGIIKGLSLSEGSVLQPGQVAFEIVPLDQEMVAEAKINPRDIGHIRVGDKVNVKVSTYDYARYGIIEGKLDSISASTFVDQHTGERYYRGKIKLNKNYVGHNPKQHRISPGMGMVADIITGDKTLLAYLMKPIIASGDRAFIER